MPLSGLIHVLGGGKTFDTAAVLAHVLKLPPVQHLNHLALERGFHEVSEPPPSQLLAHVAWEARASIILFLLGLLIIFPVVISAEVRTQVKEKAIYRILNAHWQVLEHSSDF